MNKPFLILAPLGQQTLLLPLALTLLAGPTTAEAALYTVSTDKLAKVVSAPVVLPIAQSGGVVPNVPNSSSQPNSKTHKVSAAQVKTLTGPVPSGPIPSGPVVIPTGLTPVVPGQVIPLEVTPVLLPPVTVPPQTLPAITVPPEIAPVVQPTTSPPVVTPPTVSPPTVPTTSTPASTTPTPVTTSTPILQPAPSTGTATHNGVRGLWVDGFGTGLKTRAQVSTLIKDAQRLGVNTLFVQTIRRADCLCLRSSVPVVSDHDLEAGFDPLDEVIKQAHARNIRVIAWVSVTGAGSANASSSSPDHILKSHGPTSAQSWVNRRPDGSYLENNDIWLDAGIPEASDFMAQSILSLVKNYDLDGIQFDRIRYPDGGNWGYTPTALARYNEETGTKGIPAATDPRWATWKRQQITALVRRVALEARILKPNIWVTAATITYGAPPTDLAAFKKSRTYNDVYQDWPQWTQTGLIDLNVLMNYKQDSVTNHIAWFDGWNTFALKAAGRADVAAGTALYLNTPAVSRAQMTRALGAGVGWVGYAYRTPGIEVYKGSATLPQGLEQLHQALNENNGPLRPSQWQEAPPVRYGLLGRLRGANIGGQVVEVYGDGKLLDNVVSDGNGYYGFADLNISNAQTLEVRVAGQQWPVAMQRPGVVRLPDILLREGEGSRPIHPVSVPVPVPVVTPVPTAAPTLPAAPQTTPKPRVAVPEPVRTPTKAPVTFIPVSRPALPKAMTLPAVTTRTVTPRTVTPQRVAPAPVTAQPIEPIAPRQARPRVVSAPVSRTSIPRLPVKAPVPVSRSPLASPSVLPTTKVAVPKIAAPKVTPKATAPQALPKPASAPRVAEPKVTEPKVTTPKPVTPKAVTPKAPTPKVQAPKTPATKPPLFKLPTLKLPTLQDLKNLLWPGASKK